MLRPHPTSTLFPYTTLFRSQIDSAMTRLRVVWALDVPVGSVSLAVIDTKVNDRCRAPDPPRPPPWPADRKSTRLNSSHVEISYAVFCLKKKNGLHKRRFHAR